MNGLGMFQPSQQDNSNFVQQQPSKGFPGAFSVNQGQQLYLPDTPAHETVTQAALLAQARDFRDTTQEQQYGHHQQDNGIYNNDDDAQQVSDDDNGGGGNRFRHYQADAWTSSLEQLIEFRRKHGHANVPHTSKEYPSLGRWVKRQRYQYKLMQEGKKESTMTPERAQVLEQVGFTWDAHGSTWHRRFQELHAYYLLNGNTNVPSNYPANPQLSTWVKFQRRQYKALQAGGTSRSGQHSLSPVRIRALEEVGFQWALRKSRPVK
ncbi:MAG: hypothetical protein SGARI_004483, partial [Bacillariaceae sp.]